MTSTVSFILQLDNYEKTIRSLSDTSTVCPLSEFPNTFFYFLAQFTILLQIARKSAFAL